MKNFNLLKDKFSAKRTIQLLFIFFLYFFTSFHHSSAQSLSELPFPGTKISKSPSFEPAIIRGITLHPENPLKFDFIVDRGDSNLQGAALKSEGQRMVKYFLTALTVPENELWVNLSPYEENRIIAEGLGMTAMGRDMLAQDYILKQLTASIINPDEDFGKKFWDRIYQRAQSEFGISEIPVNIFNKVWIVPKKAVIYEQWPSAFVVNSHLKVMLEEDYLALQRNSSNEDIGGKEINQNASRNLRRLSSRIIKEVILPEIEREVNEGKNFSRLRQIANSIILAAWYKQKLKGSLLGSVYFNKNKIAGIDIKDKKAKQKIYNQYLEAFQKGVFNFIKNDFDQVKQEVIPRKYFAGGEQFTRYFIDPDGLQIITDFSQIEKSSPLLKANKKGDLALLSVMGYEIGHDADIHKAWKSNAISPGSASSPKKDSAMTASKEQRAQLISYGQRYIDRLSQEDNYPLEQINVFLVMGNPDLNSFLNFVKIWKNLKNSIPIVIAGGRGRGTRPLIDKVLAYYENFDSAENGLTQLQKDKLMQAETVEADVIRIIFEKEGIPLRMIYKESRPSSNTRENFLNSHPVIESLVNNLEQTPVVAVVTSPPLLLRAKATAEKIWKDSGWNIIKIRPYQMHINSLTDSELIQFLGYVAGYPEAYRKMHERLNQNSEFQGTQTINNPNVHTVELTDDEWNLLSDLKKSFYAFLQLQENLIYDEKKNILTIPFKEKNDLFPEALIRSEHPFRAASNYLVGDLGYHDYASSEFKNKVLPLILSKHVNDKKVRMGLIGLGTGEEGAEFISAFIEGVEENPEKWGKVDDWELNFIGVEIDPEFALEAEKRLSGKSPFLIENSRNRKFSVEIIDNLHRYAAWVTRSVEVIVGDIRQPEISNRFKGFDLIIESTGISSDEDFSHYLDKEIGQDAFLIGISLRLWLPNMRHTVHWENGAFDNALNTIWIPLWALESWNKALYSKTDENLPLGGINFKFFDLQIHRDAKGIPLPMLQQPISDIKIEGIFPVITKVTNQYFFLFLRSGLKTN